MLHMLRMTSVQQQQRKLAGGIHARIRKPTDLA